MPVYIDTYLSYKWPDYVAGAYAKVCIVSSLFSGMASVFCFILVQLHGFYSECNY